eukprot:6175728-Amphidinium_carterae.1
MDASLGSSVLDCLAYWLGISCDHAPWQGMVLSVGRQDGLPLYASLDDHPDCFTLVRFTANPKSHYCLDDIGPE